MEICELLAIGKILSAIFMSLVVLYGIIIGIKKISDVMVDKIETKKYKIYKNWKSIISKTFDNKKKRYSDVINTCWDLYTENEELLFYFKSNKVIKNKKKIKEFNERLRKFINYWYMNLDDIEVLSKKQKEENIKLTFEFCDLANRRYKKLYEDLCEMS